VSSRDKSHRAVETAKHSVIGAGKILFRYDPPINRSLRNLPPSFQSELQRAGNLPMLHAETDVSIYLLLVKNMDSDLKDGNLTEEVVSQNDDISFCRNASTAIFLRYLNFILPVISKIFLLR
jgi:hypothetical protein